MVHMPSHIDVLRGRWREAVAANERAIRSDANYLKVRPRQGFYNLYMTHNRHMLGFAAMMVGQREKALKAMDDAVKGMPVSWIKENASFVDPFLCTPLEVRVRFGQWDDILAWPEYPNYLPFSESMRHMARGVAFAAKGQTFEAEAEQALYRDARKKVAPTAPVGNSSASVVLDLADHLLAGEIHLSAGRMDEALGEIRRAVRFDDQLRYDEPPDWMIPTRHVLGVALLKAGRPAEAEEVYRQDLRKLPMNGWALAGLSTALERQGKKAEAARTKAAFERIWASADTMITSSCMCVPRP
jgi:tetratricopeptide (TPR) repeat protein